MSLNKLAGLGGISRSQLFYVLAQECSPTLDWLEKVANALKVPAWKMVEERK